MTVSVYVLIDPFDHKPKYVGISRSPGSRLAQHIAGTKKFGEQRIEELKERLRRPDFFKDAWQPPLSLKEWLGDLSRNDHTPDIVLLREIDCTQNRLFGETRISFCECKQYCKLALQAEKEVIEAIEAQGFELFNIRR